MRAVAIAAAVAAVFCARPFHCASMIHVQLPAPQCVSVAVEERRLTSMFARDADPCWARAL